MSIFRGEKWRDSHYNVVFIVHVFPDHAFNLGLVCLIDGRCVLKCAGKIENAKVGALWARQLNLQNLCYKVLSVMSHARSEAHEFGRNLLELA